MRHTSHPHPHSHSLFPILFLVPFLFLFLPSPAQNIPEYPLEPVTITERKFETVKGCTLVYPVKRIYIHDYGFLGDETAVLSRDPSGKISRVELLDEDYLIREASSGKESICSLFNDCEGKLWACGADSVYAVEKGGGRLALHPMPKDSFDRYIAPCKAVWNGNKLYEFARNNLDKTVWYPDSTIQSGEGRLVVRVADEEKIRQMKEEGFPVNRPFGAEELVHSALAENPATMTEMFFLSKTLFAPLYLPVFSHKNQLYVFDHVKGRMDRLLPNGELFASHPIRYHRNRQWKKMLIQDAESGRIFALNDHYGNTSLSEINPDTGEAGADISIPLPFPYKIQVRNGELYFLYKETNYEDVKRLYRMPLPGALQN